MQFESFHWLSHQGFLAIIPCFTNMGVSIFYFSLKFSQCCRRYFYSICTCVVVHLPSRIKTHARGIIVDYMAELFRDEKTIADWFPLRYKFCNTGRKIDRSQLISVNWFFTSLIKINRFFLYKVKILLLYFWGIISVKCSQKGKEKHK